MQSACVVGARDETTRERLAQRRRALLQRSSELRERLAMQGAAIAPAAVWIDQVRSGWRWLRARPWIATGLVLLLVWRRPRAAGRVAFMIWRGWRWWRRVRSYWSTRRGVTINKVA
jgi:hypothetical protein